MFKQLLNQLHIRTIRAHLLFWFLVIGLLPVLVVSIVFFTVSQNALQTALQDNLAVIAEKKVSQIEGFLREREQSISLIALSPMIRQATAELLLAIENGETDTALQESVQGVLGEYAAASGVGNIWLVTHTGQLLAMAYGPDEEPNLPLTQVDIGLMADYIRQTGRIYQTQFIYLPEQDKWHSFFAAPVMHNNELIGILITQIDGRDIEQIVNELDDLGRTGETLIGTRQEDEFRVINRPRYATEGFQSSIPYGGIGYFHLQEGYQQASEGFEVAPDYRGEMTAIYYRQVPGLGWGMVVKKDVDEAFDSIKRQQNMLGIAFAVSILIIGLTAPQVARQFSLPIMRLHDTVHGISTGNLQARAKDTDRQDEIGELAIGVNYMADELATTFGRLEERIQERTAQLVATAEISRRIVELRNPDELLQLVVNTIQERFGFYFVALMMVDEATQQAVITAVAGLPSEANSLTGYTLSLRLNSITSWVVRERRPYASPDVQDDPHYVPHPALPYTASEISLPLLSNGSVLGVLDLQSDRRNAFHEEDAASLQGLADQITIALENGRLFQQSQRYARDMVQARELAEEANRSKSAFLANMSHELRTPMNAIIGFSQVMERDNSLSDKQREYLRIISRSSDHLLNLINDVLEMSKIEAGRMVLTEQAFDLHHTLNDVKELFHVRAEGKNLHMHFGIAGDVPRYVVSDEGKLRQVLINLLSNAIKFTDKGGISVRVGYEAADVAPRLHFAVEDTGEGIAPEELQVLFEPFVQTASGLKRQEGTGLGMTITRQFIHLLGGEISVQSNLGEGTVVQFEIQITLARPEDVRGETVYRRVLSLRPDVNGQIPQYRILVVDDRPENRQLMREWLHAVGFEVREAADGREAIAQWEAWQPHLIWMDMRMPVMDGYEATRLIKSSVKEKHPIIIALTASALEHERSIVLSAGCDDFVRKPVREALVFEKMGEFLGVRYEYEQLVAEPMKLNPFDRSADGLATAVTQLPPELVVALQQAAVEIDIDAAQQTIHQIAHHNPDLAEILAELVEHYRFDHLQKILTP